VSSGSMDSGKRTLHKSGNSILLLPPSSHNYLNYIRIEWISRTRYGFTI